MAVTKKTIYEPSLHHELCRTCGGEGTTPTRGYQQSMDEARTVRCKGCNGLGEHPEGTYEKLDRELLERRKERLQKRIAEDQKKLREISTGGEVGPGGPCCTRRKDQEGGD